MIVAPTKQNRDSQVKVKVDCPVHYDVNTSVVWARGHTPSGF